MPARAIAWWLRGERSGAAAIRKDSKIIVPIGGALPGRDAGGALAAVDEPVYSNELRQTGGKSHVARGRVDVNGHVLSAGDALKTGAGSIAVSGGEAAEVLVFDLPAGAH